MKKYSVSFIALSSFIIFTCGSCSQKTGSSNVASTNMSTKKAEISQQDGGVTLDGCTEQTSIKKGNTLTILLPANAGTGYQWMESKPPNMLRRENQNELKYKDAAAQPANPPMVGGAKKQILTYTAVGGGTETLDLIYVRAWEKDKVERRCSVKVAIEE